MKSLVPFRYCVLLALILMAGPLAAAPASPRPTPPKERLPQNAREAAPLDANCLISVTSIPKHEDPSTRVFPMKLKSKAACEEAAKQLETNFAPDRVQKKIVKMDWRGKP